MKKIFLLFFIVVGCTILRVKIVSDKETHQDKLNALYHKIDKNEKAIDSLIEINHPNLKRDNSNSIIRPDGVSLSGKPIYYKTYHGRSQVEFINASDVKNPDGAYNLNGEGIQVHVWDSKSIFDTHQEFVDPNTGESIIETSPNETQDIESSHGTRVASVIMALGVSHDEDNDVRGIAPNISKLNYFNFNNDIFEILQELESNPDFIISNHSYGFYIFNEDDEQVFDAWEIGEYGDKDQLIDETANLYPYWLYVNAAGNEGDLSYEGQEYPKYDYLTNGSIAKNQLNVASLNLQTEFGYFISPSGFSSSGPTNSFRISPHISALGSQVYCATWNSEKPMETNWYSLSSGTSFSSPAVAGGAALLQQHYKNLHSTYMRSSTLKGLICHTATDITQWGAKTVIGPDPKTGYGLLNVEKAVEVIQSTASKPLRIIEQELANNGTFQLNFMTDSSDEPLIVTLAWNDPYKQTLLTEKDLVNDLDIRVYNETDTYYPWKLDENDITSSALKGDNTVDNLEKIEIENPKGSYVIEVSHKEILSENQNFSLIISGSGNTSTLSSDLMETGLEKIVSTFNKEQNQITVYQIYNTHIFKSFALYDLSGRLIENSVLNDVSSFKINTFGLNSNVYIVEVKTNSSRFTTKVVVK